MAVCGIIAGVGGIFFFEGFLPFIRAYLCALISTIMGGIFVGLVIGVAIDSLVGVFRKKDGKKRRDRWSSLP